MLEQEIKRAVKTRQKDGKAQSTSDLAEAVTSAHVVEAVSKQKRIDIVEQMLYMDPIRELGNSADHLDPVELRVLKSRWCWSQACR